MKSGDKKGKLFGILNIVDIVIIVLILVVGAVGISIVIKNDEVVAVGGTKSITYTVEGQNVVADAAHLPKVNDKVYNSSTSNYLGEVSKVEIMNQTKVEFNTQKGIYEKYEVPNLFTVHLTIKGSGFDTDQNITVEDTVVKVGKELNVKGKGYAFGGFIIAVNLEENALDDKTVDNVNTDNSPK